VSFDAFAPAHRITADIRDGAISAKEVVGGFLQRIHEINPAINAFTDVTAERALAQASAIDARRAAGKTLGPLAGMPFAAKNLFDITGLPTRAGSKINRARVPSERDAVLIERLTRADAILLGGLNMGEYAYDFTGENAHDGPCRNPHDLARMAGGLHQARVLRRPRVWRRSRSAPIPTARSGCRARFVASSG
jgi:Asp-tRNA(Asn)/Glu-tRNA(Gln) amidotransferase A subunit family amidase